MMPTEDLCDIRGMALREVKRAADQVMRDMRYETRRRFLVVQLCDGGTMAIPVDEIGRIFEDKFGTEIYTSRGTRIRVKETLVVLVERIHGGRE